MTAMGYSNPICTKFGQAVWNYSKWLGYLKKKKVFHSKRWFRNDRSYDSYDLVVRFDPNLVRMHETIPNTQSVFTHLKKQKSFA